MYKMYIFYKLFVRYFIYKLILFLLRNTRDILWNCVTCFLKLLTEERSECLLRHLAFCDRNM